MRGLLRDFDHEMKTPTKLLMGNKSAMWLSEKMGAFAKDKPRRTLDASAGKTGLLPMKEQKD